MSEPARRPPEPRPTLRFASRVLFPILLAVVFLSLLSCSDDFRKVANLDSPGTVIVFFGDSLTAGYEVGKDRAFPALIAKHTGIPVINAGIDGDTSAEALARIEGDVLRHNPRLVVVEFGGNDFLKKVDKKQTFEKLDRIVERITQHGAMVVMLGLRIGLFRDEYIKGYENVADAHGALLIPNFMSGIMGNPKMTVDGIHPNAQGHELIAERVMEKLVPLLAEADRARAGKQQAP